MRQSRDYRSRVAWMPPRRPLCDARFITRMAAVAGSVADEVLAAMVAAAPLSRAWANNGGDIAMHLSPGTVFDVAMAGGLPDSRDTKRPHPEKARRAVSKDELQGIQTGPSFATQPSAALQDELSVTDGPSLFGTTRITYADPVRGIATSGFGGRSFSLGIADAVTVFDARCRGCRCRRDAGRQCRRSARPSCDRPRTCATDFDPQSDLCAQLITRSVSYLLRDEIGAALDAGVREAKRLRAEGHLVSAALAMRGQVRMVGEQGRSEAFSPTPAPPVRRDSLHQSAAAHR